MEEIIWSAVIAALVGCAVVYKKSLTLPGAMLAAIMIMAISFFAGLANMTYLLFTFALIYIADSFIKRKKKDDNAKGEQRSIIQVAANGLIACIMTLVYAFTKDEAYIIAYIAVLTESLADSLASDIGVYSKREPIDICSFKRMQTGISGGISLLGTASSFIGSFIVALYAAIIRGFKIKEFLIIIIAPMLGMLFDSVLGSLFQLRYSCTVCGELTEKKTHCGKAAQRIAGPRFLNNNAVNFLSNIFAAAAAVLLYNIC